MAARSEQPTPCLCSRFAFRLFAPLDVVIFASSNLHSILCVDNLPASPPAPLHPSDDVGRTDKLTLCTTGVFCRTSLAACKALASCSLWALFVCLQTIA